MKRGEHHAFRSRERAIRFVRAKWLSEMVLRSLGGCCATCGEENMSLLTVDHMDGVTFDRYALRYDARVARYIQELVSGVKLRCLCLVCNGRFGQLAQMREPGEDVVTYPDEDFMLPELPDAPF